MSAKTRRDFLKSSAALSAAATLAATPLVHAGSNSTLKIGLIGAGGRGTGAASQALLADRDVKLWSVGDAFEDRVEGSLRALQGNPNIATKIDVPRERRFTGFNSYQQVIDSGVDVVLLCSPPGFRPQHLEAAVRAGKHIFCEKPMAVDGPGIRKVIEVAEQARQRRLALVAGFCWRYYNPMRETVRRIHDGELGDITTLHCNYITGALWHRTREQGWTDMQWQVRNWPYFTWLSGDFNVEQHIHSLDKMGWLMKNEYPVKAYGLGGRQVRTGPEFGHIYDHMAVVYEWANGVRCFAFCRQQAGCHSETSDSVFGTKGRGFLLGAGGNPSYSITGERPWRYPAAQQRRDIDMYQSEHNELFASIRAGNPINDGAWMAKSTLMGILGRMVCYTGALVTWDQALNSQENLVPQGALTWETAPPNPPVARPGVTRFF